jgi:hypothetical protein
MLQMILALTLLKVRTTKIAGCWCYLEFWLDYQVHVLPSTPNLIQTKYGHFLVWFLCRPIVLMGIVLIILYYCVLTSGLRCPIRFPYEMMFGSSFSSVVCFTAYVLFMHLFVFIVLPRIDCMSSIVGIY